MQSAQAAMKHIALAEARAGPSLLRFGGTKLVSAPLMLYVVVFLQAYWLSSSSPFPG